MRTELIYDHQLAASCAQVGRPYVVGLACGFRLVHRLWDLGDAFHSHAGVLARVAHRLQRSADRPLADHRRRRHGLRSGDRPHVTMERRGAWLGGAVVGAGIAAMHYTGMAAFEVPGRIDWDASLVDASIAIGAVLAAAALYVGLRGEARRWTLLGTLLLTAAICGLHFTAMGAASVTPDPTIDLSASSVPSGLLAIGSGAREYCRRCAGPRRRGDRHARPAARGARGRADAWPCQCGGGGSACLRRRHCRYRQRQLRGC